MVDPKVAVLMGSVSDEAVMEQAAELLEEFGVEYDKQVISAHRNPKKLATYVESAAEKGIMVFIAGAGKAAHLAGAIAALTSSPVIAVPIAGSDLGGVDALLSMVQMPSGVPVATVAINGAKNAAILAVQILALSDQDLVKKLSDFKKEIAV